MKTDRQFDDKQTNRYFGIFRGENWSAVWKTYYEKKFLASESSRFARCRRYTRTVSVEASGKKFAVSSNFLVALENGAEQIIIIETADRVENSGYKKALQLAVAVFRHQHSIATAVYYNHETGYRQLMLDGEFANDQSILFRLTVSSKKMPLWQHLHEILLHSKTRQKMNVAELQQALHARSIHKSGAIIAATLHHNRHIFIRPERGCFAIKRDAT